MIECSSGKIPNGNVVLCWFEPKEQSSEDAKMPAKKKTRRK
jgi:hypothetical protein